MPQTDRLMLLSRGQARHIDGYSAFKYGRVGTTARKAGGGPKSRYVVVPVQSDFWQVGRQATELAIGRSESVWSSESSWQGNAGFISSTVGAVMGEYFPNHSGISCCRNTTFSDIGTLDPLGIDPKRYTLNALSP